MAKSNVIEIETNKEHTELEYIYVTIPAEYVCVYHRILAMLADYGVDMLKDCKATCKDRNSGVIECFNMFNAAVAARQLGKSASISNDAVNENKYTKLAATLIKYIKAKINQIYGGEDNSTSFVFPVDENGEIKAFVSCGERPMFSINPEDGKLYEHKFANGFDEHFRLGKEDFSEDVLRDANTIMAEGTAATKILQGTLVASYENIGDNSRACADITATYDGVEIDLNKASVSYYFDDEPVNRFNDISNPSLGNHKFTCVIKYKGLTSVVEKILKYEGPSRNIR